MTEKGRVQLQREGLNLLLLSATRGQSRDPGFPYVYRNIPFFTGNLIRMAEVGVALKS